MFRHWVLTRDAAMERLCRVSSRDASSPDSTAAALTRIANRLRTSCGALGRTMMACIRSLPVEMKIVEGIVSLMDARNAEGGAAEDKGA